MNANIVVFECGPHSEVNFGWEDPLNAHILSVELQFMGPLHSKFASEQLEINFECPLLEYSVQNEFEQLEISIRVESLGLRRYVWIGEKTEEEEIVEEKSNKLAVSLSDIGISLIGGEKRMEIIYFSLKTLLFMMIERQSLRSITLRMKYIQIDNNCNHNTLYPILLTPLKHEKALNKPRFFFVLSLEQELRYKKQFKALRICIEPLSIKIHDEVVEELSKFQKRAMDLWEEQENNKFKTFFVVDYEWERNPLMKLEDEIFFKEIEINKITIEISFCLLLKSSKGNFIVVTIISSFGVAISNVSESQLVLSRFLRRDVSSGQLLRHLSDFYMKSFIKGIYKLLGSLNLLGSPYIFIRLIGEGLWEVVNQPTEGFIKGPIEGAVGVLKGGVYFGRNIIAATFNSFEAVSESCSRGVGYLTMDDHYVQKREKIKVLKSANLVLGMKYAGISLLNGFEHAVKGLWVQPRDGYRSDGWRGVLSGGFKGVVGIVTKPLCGILAGVSKLSEGIKNTALAFQDRPNTKRARPPRVFYSRLQYYAAYHYLHSYALSIIEFNSTKFLDETILFIAIEGKEKPIATILTFNYFLTLHLQTKIISQEIKLEDIDSVEITESELYIDLKKERIFVDIEAIHELYAAFKEIQENEQF